jgi:hypothetical protein
METINLKINSDEALLLINALNLLDINCASAFNQVFPSLSENEKVKAKTICIKYRKTIENLTGYITASKL